MVQNNQKGRQSLSKSHKQKAQEVKTYKKGLMKLGHPADCNSEKETVQAKNRDNKIKEERGSTNPQQKGMTAYFKISHQHLNHHWNIRTKTQTRSSV